MVKVPEGFCIDSTEVTRKQYAEWIATGPSTAAQDAWCAWNSGADAFLPRADWPPTGDGDQPVGYVDWCDAYAYCKGVGKRLCGRIGGGPAGFGEFDDASASQWYAACSSGGKFNYPYGGNSAATDGGYGNVDGYDSQACNGKDKGVGAALAVGTFAACRSKAVGYEGILDMSGNVSEWIDSCDGTQGESDDCRVGGGDFASHAEFLACGDWLGVTNRSYSAAGIGFRCCAP